MNFDLMEKEIRVNNINVIRWVLYENGEITERTLVKSYPCSNCYSISKAFTATAVGLLYDMGKITPDDYIADILKDELPGKYDDNLKKVKIRHLLTHTTGFAEGCLFEGDRYNHNTDDFFFFFLSSSICYELGTVFAYSNASTYILSCAVEKITGTRMDLFLRERLFSKIGITQYAWECCPTGHTMGATGLYLPTRDLLRLGILYLNNGLWENERVISEKWVEMATSVQSAQNNSGYGFWVDKENKCYSAMGAFSQTLCIIPEKNIVFAEHAFESENGDTLEKISKKYLGLL
jgi:CubicO group peptidase (beta-lactamase class C family)